MIGHIEYTRADGVKVRSIATYSYRRGPIGEWMVGNTPLDVMKLVFKDLRWTSPTVCTIDLSKMFADA